MVIIAACSSSAHQLLDLLSDRCFLLALKPVAQPGCSAAVMLFRRLSAAKILSQWFEAERSRGAQGPGERPAPPREVQAGEAGMQVRTPARQPGPRVGLDDVPSRYEAKQAGLDRTLLAAYTGTHRGYTRDMPLGSYGHYDNKSTVSAGLQITGETRAGGAAEAAAPP
jgi:hypothetical protein